MKKGLLFRLFPRYPMMLILMLNPIRFLMRLKEIPQLHMKVTGCKKNDKI